MVKLRRGSSLVVASTKHSSLASADLIQHTFRTALDESGCYRCISTSVLNSLLSL